MKLTNPEKISMKDLLHATQDLKQDVSSKFSMIQAEIAQLKLETVIKQYIQDLEDRVSKLGTEGVSAGGSSAGHSWRLIGSMCGV